LTKCKKCDIIALIELSGDMQISDYRDSHYNRNRLGVATQVDKGGNISYATLSDFIKVGNKLKGGCK
jgi:hypothetical protein